jgi:hypothetical protein
VTAATVVDLIAVTSIDLTRMAELVRQYADSSIDKLRRRATLKHRQGSPRRVAR